MAYLKDPTGAIINLALFALIGTPKFVGEKGDEPNPNGDYAVYGHTVTSSRCMLFQGNPEECAAFREQIENLLFEERMARRSDMPSARNPTDSIVLTLEEREVIREALALHRSMAECGENPSVTSWGIYGRAMRALGNKSGAEHAAAMICKLQREQAAEEAKKERRLKHEPMVYILRTGSLTGTNCPRQVPLACVKPFEKQIIAHARAKHEESGGDLVSWTQTTIEDQCRIEGWDLYDAIKGPEVAKAEKLRTGRAQEVAAFIVSLADGTYLGNRGPGRVEWAEKSPEVQALGKAQPVKGLRETGTIGIRLSGALAMSRICPTSIRLEYLRPFEPRILTYLNKQRHERGQDADQCQLNEGEWIDGWDLYHALSMGPVGDYSDAEAATVARFLLDLSEGKIEVNEHGE